MIAAAERSADKERLSQYEPSRWWFEFVLLFSKMLFVTLSVLLNSARRAWLLLGALSLLTIVTLALVVVDKPFRGSDSATHTGDRADDEDESDDKVKERGNQEGSEPESQLHLPERLQGGSQEPEPELEPQPEPEPERARVVVSSDVGPSEALHIHRSDGRELMSARVWADSSAMRPLANVAARYWGTELSQVRSCSNAWVDNAVLTSVTCCRCALIDSSSVSYQTEDGVIRGSISAARIKL